MKLTKYKIFKARNLWCLYHLHWIPRHKSWDGHFLTYDRVFDIKYFEGYAREINCQWASDVDS